MQVLQQKKSEERYSQPKLRISREDFIQLSLELARKSFYGFNQIMYPKHYKPNRHFLKVMSDEMQNFIESDDKVLIISAPPRHYKSFTGTNFCQWYVGNFPNKKIMTGSYNETLSETFSKAVRNTIDTVKVDPDKIVYSDIFPNVKIKRGDGAVRRWALEGYHATYLATSPTGTATGFGCDLMIIDDIIKSAYEANNVNILENHWNWFKDTMLSRLEENGKIIIIMTRWHSKDLAGRAYDHFNQIGWNVRQITFKAKQDDGTMLCDEILSAQSYHDKTITMGEDIASANYQQTPIDIKGKLYTSFKTYEKLPTDIRGKYLFDGIYAYCDTADQGSDSLCLIIYGVYLNEAYILDVYFTKDAMEITERETAKRLTEHDVNLAIIESNNGGRGFSRAVMRLLSEELKNYITIIKWVTQTKNKKSRILTMAPWVMEHIYFPINWRNKWPEYYEAMNSYQRDGTNQHDDAPDCTTAVAEYVSKPNAGVVNINVG